MGEKLLGGLKASYREEDLLFATSKGRARTKGVFGEQPV